MINNNTNIQQIMCDINALMNYSQISRDDSCIQSYISILKIMAKIDALKKNQENFQNVVLKKVFNIILTVTQFDSFITTAINISVTAAIIKTTRQPPPPKKRTWAQTVQGEPPSLSSNTGTNGGYILVQKRKDFKNVFTNLFNSFMQNNKIIITFKTPIKKFNPGQMQNAINAALNFNHVSIVITIVSKTIKNNIAIIIMKNNADELISNVNL